MSIAWRRKTLHFHSLGFCLFSTDINSASGPVKIASFAIFKPQKFGMQKVFFSSLLAKGIWPTPAPNRVKMTARRKIKNEK